MMPVQRVKAQPRVWPLSTEPPPWVWTMPSAAGLCALSSTPHATLLTSARPPPLRAVTSWQLPCDPFLPPLISPLPVPNVQWELTSRPPMMGFQPSAGVDLVPVFPIMYRTVLHPHYGKSWLEKRRPEYKVYLNNALETWIGPEEVGIFQHQEKPVLMTNRVAMSISRPTAASRNFHTLLVTPRRISGCPVAIKRVRSNKRMALATAALVAMESDMAQRPSVSLPNPLHLLSFSPIKIPLLTSPNPGPRGAWERLLSPVLPTQLTAMRSLSAPAVTLLAGDWKDKKAPEKKLEVRKRPCTTALVLHTDSTPVEVCDHRFLSSSLAFPDHYIGVTSDSL
ncbi:Transcription elongation regulator 1-like protein [Bagarius yarrelli]|uniref:Transcription elongation regulator 1-like protein n=1 Tax=Bagarius yarrelli TaxID=175774 RepID=A0A556TJI7_BAGYA|nr:Transcription elongation regulator 1-like protein [Bagarius yarrelli]